MDNRQIIDRKSTNNRWINDKKSIIFIDNRLDWMVRSYYRLDCLSISIAIFYIDWIGLD